MSSGTQVAVSCVYCLLILEVGRLILQELRHGWRILRQSVFNIIFGSGGT